VEQRYVGSSGLRVSLLGLGTLQWGADTDLEEAAEILDRFVDAGGTTVDVTAGVGEGADVLGRLLGATHRREDLVLIARSGVTGTLQESAHDVSRRALLADLDRTLHMLGTDHVDVWLADGWSDDVPLAETVSAIESAVSGGRARYAGVTNQSGWQTARAGSVSTAVTAASVEWSLVARAPELELVPACSSMGIGLIAWGALGRGVLTGKYRGGIPSDSRAATAHLGAYVAERLDARSRRVVDAVVTAADGLAVPPGHVALGWLAGRPMLSCAVVGPRTAAQLRGLLDGTEFELPPEIAEVLEEVSRP
jgi:aryl-alcohol dehydrogenase-like predicted oxidoreductase